jgi:hypothetical protein
MTEAVSKVHLFRYKEPNTGKWRGLYVQAEASKDWVIDFFEGEDYDYDYHGVFEAIDDE